MGQALSRQVDARITSQSTTTMSYMQDLEARLKPLLGGVPASGVEVIIREMKAIALESYRNGQKAGAPAAKRPAEKQAVAKTGTR